MREPYLLNGEVVPSVTEILTMYGGGFENLMVWSNNLGKKGKDYEEELEFLADVGTCTHAWIEQELTGEPMPEFPEKVWKSGEKARAAFQRWAEGKNLNVIDHEKRYVSRAWEVGGTVDLVCSIDDGPLVVVDFKTASAIRPKNIAQVAAYVEMVNEVDNRDIDTAIILRFGRNGSAGELVVQGELMRFGLTAFLNAMDMWRLDQYLSLEVKKEVPLQPYVPNTPAVYCRGVLTVGTA